MISQQRADPVHQRLVITDDFPDQGQQCQVNHRERRGGAGLGEDRESTLRRMTTAPPGDSGYERRHGQPRRHHGGQRVTQAVVDRIGPMLEPRLHRLDDREQNRRAEDDAGRTTRFDSNCGHAESYHSLRPHDHSLQAD